MIKRENQGNMKRLTGSSLRKHNSPALPCSHFQVKIMVFTGTIGNQLATNQQPTGDHLRDSFGFSAESDGDWQAAPAGTCR